MKKKKIDIGGVINRPCKECHEILDCFSGFDTRGKAVLLCKECFRALYGNDFDEALRRYFNEQHRDAKQRTTRS